MGEFLAAPQSVNAAIPIHKNRRMRLILPRDLGLIYNTLMQMRTHLLFPFDLGLELDFSGHDAEEIFKQVSSRKTASVIFDGVTYAEASVVTQIYKFGVGSIEISFNMGTDLSHSAQLSCFAENVWVGKMPIIKYCQSHVD